jgi:hypothetical protein
MYVYIYICLAVCVSAYPFIYPAHISVYLWINESASPTHIAPSARHSRTIWPLTEQPLYIITVTIPGIALSCHFEQYCLLGCDAVKSCRRSPTFRKNILPPASGSVPSVDRLWVVRRCQCLRIYSVDDDEWWIGKDLERRGRCLIDVLSRHLCGWKKETTENLIQNSRRFVQFSNQTPHGCKSFFTAWANVFGSSTLKCEFRVFWYRSCLLGYKGVWSAERQLTFRSNTSPPSSALKNKPSKKPAGSKENSAWLIVQPWRWRRYIPEDIRVKVRCKAIPVTGCGGP